MLLILTFFGCAAPQTRSLLESTNGNKVWQIELDSVPFYPQEIHQCGPAALATVLGAAGVGVTPQELISQVFLPGREGSLQVELLAATRRYGLLAYQLAPSLYDLLVEVAAGSPVLVMQNLGLSWYPVWHYAVVVGFDLQKEEIILRSGTERRMVMSLATFEHTWERAGYWAMLVMPANLVPGTVDESTFLAAAVALERAGQAISAQQAYASAVKRWPSNLTAYIGLGNIYYAQGDMSGAERVYHQATLAHPESAIAFNNLAQTLADQQRFAEARDAALNAVRLGGWGREAALETLQQIEMSMPK